MRILILALLLAGCAAMPARHVESSWSEPGPGLQTVTVERPSRWPGGAPLLVWVDGKVSAEVPGGQAINLYLPEGRHIIGVGMPGRSGSEAPERTIVVDVTPGSQPLLRASIVALGYGGWEIEQVR